MEVTRGVDHHQGMDRPTGFGSKNFPDPVSIKTDITQQHQKVTRISVHYHYDSLQKSLEDIGLCKKEKR